MLMQLKLSRSLVAHSVLTSELTDTRFCILSSRFDFLHEIPVDAFELFVLCERGNMVRLESCTQTRSRIDSDDEKRVKVTLDIETNGRMQGVCEHQRNGEISPGSASM
jgi:hypothetical protein